MKSQIEVRPAQAEQLRPLRLSVLRPGRAASEAIFDGDDDPETVHLAAFSASRIVGTASLFRRGFPFADSASTCGASWQLRGMAVDPELQGRGVGRALLRGCVEQVARRGGGTLWCNARLAALGFYRGEGFETFGEQFEIPDVGPHFVMARSIERDAST